MLRTIFGEEEPPGRYCEWSIMDPRHERLVELLIHHSTRLQAGEHVLIEAFDIPESMVIAAVKAAKLGAYPTSLLQQRLQRALIENATDAQVATQAEYDRFRMEKMDAYLGLRGGNNANELAGLPGEVIVPLEYGVPDPSALPPR